MGPRTISLLRSVLPCLNLALTCLICVAAGCDTIEARMLTKEGNDLYQQGKLEQALKSFEQAAKIDPQFALTQLHIGYTCMGLATGRSKEESLKFNAQAAKAFARYMQLRPQDNRGPRFYLQVLTEAGRHKEALAFLLEQHKKRPQDTSVVEQLGAISSKMGNFAQALRWYEKRAQLAPKEPKARYLIGTLCWEHLYKNEGVVGVKRVALADRGLSALREAVDLQPEYVEAITYINLLYRERAKGQTDEKAKERDLQRARKFHQRALRLIKGAAAKKTKTNDKQDQGKK